MLTFHYKKWYCKSACFCHVVRQNVSSILTKVWTAVGKQLLSVSKITRNSNKLITSRTLRMPYGKRVDQQNWKCRCLSCCGNGDAGSNCNKRVRILGVCKNEVSKSNYSHSHILVHLEAQNLKKCSWVQNSKTFLCWLQNTTILEPVELFEQARLMHSVDMKILGEELSWIYCCTK